MKSGSSSSSSSSSNGKERRFWNYPLPQEAPQVPDQRNVSSNPVLRGYALTIVVWILSASSFITWILWKNAKFDRLKHIKELNRYEPRYDPTVVPVEGKSPLKETPNLAALSPRTRSGPSQHYTSADYVALYREGKVTPSAVVEKIIPSIDRESNGKHSIAFLQSNADLVRQAAEASTKRYREGTPLGPLDGVPVAIKDEADLKGYTRTLGSALEFTNPDDETAWCVQQWEQAGAVVIGKTNMHELGLDTTNNNPISGTPRNPHHSDHYCGGSSGGSAYVIATGLVPIALGADGGGSIRIPAAMCGLFGLKPSHGRVSSRPTRNIGQSVGVYGPLAGSIDDLRLAYRIMAKPDPKNPTSAMFPSPQVLPGQQTFRPKDSDNAAAKPTRFLGICTPLISQASSSVRAIFDRVVARYVQDRNYTVVEISLPFLGEAMKAHAITILSEIGLSFLTGSGGQSSSNVHNENNKADNAYGRQTTQPSLSSLSAPSRLVLLASSRHGSATDFLAAQRLRNLLMQHFAHLWQQYPGMLIITPTLPDEGMPIKDARDVSDGGSSSACAGVSDADASLRSMIFAFLANLTGCPSISRPMAFPESKSNHRATSTSASPSTEKHGENGSTKIVEEDPLSSSSSLSSAIPPTATAAATATTLTSDHPDVASSAIPVPVPLGIMAMGEWGSEEQLMDWAEEGEGLI